MNNLKVLHCIHSLDVTRGGPANFLASISNVAEDLGMSLHVLCIEEPSPDTVALIKAPVTVAGPGAGNYGFSLKYLSLLRQMARTSDVVVVHGVWNFASFGAHLICKQLRKPYVVFTHGMLDPWFGKRYPLKQLKKQIYWLLAECRTLADAARVFFTSREESELAGIGFWPFKVDGVVVPYGIVPPTVSLEDCKNEFNRKFPAICQSDFMLYLGRIAEKKGLDMLVTAHQKLGGKSLLVVAGPDQDNYLDKLRRQAGDDLSIVWLDTLTGALKWGAIAAARVFVLPSHQENFGVVVVEALACGTPVLLSKRVNIWREVVEAGAGIAEEDSTEGVTRLLERYAGWSNEERQKMSMAASKCFDDNFNLVSNARIYKQLLEESIRK